MSFTYPMIEEERIRKEEEERLAKEEQARLGNYGYAFTNHR